MKSLYYQAIRTVAFDKIRTVCEESLAINFQVETVMLESAGPKLDLFIL